MSIRYTRDWESDDEIQRQKEFVSSSIIRLGCAWTASEAGTTQDLEAE
jgi:hypothetical protein